MSSDKLIFGGKSGFGVSRSQFSLLQPWPELQNFDSTNLHNSTPVREVTAFRDVSTWLSDSLLAADRSTVALNNARQADISQSDGQSTAQADEPEGSVGDVDLPSIITSDWPDQVVVEFWREQVADDHGGVLDGSNDPTIEGQPTTNEADGGRPNGTNDPVDDGDSAGALDVEIGDVDLPSIITSDWPDQDVVAFWRDYFSQTHGDLFGLT